MNTIIPSNKENLPGHLSFFRNKGFEQNLPSGVSVLHGGSINQVFLIDVSGQKQVVKYNSRKDLPGLFEAEEQGMKFLRDNSEFFVPKVLTQYTCNDFSLLALEYFESTESPSFQFWYDSGRKLAALHRKSSSWFGFENDNYFADIVVDNQPSADWVDFYILRRLEPLIRLNVDEGRISTATIRLVERMYKKLDDIFPGEVPALLHGDLWSGNFLKGVNAQAALIDPAVYFGHREMDLAMTTLFGGFEAGFYEGYEEHFPLEKDWRKRAGIAQLFPLLYHSYKFGGQYITRVKEVVAVF